MVPDIMLGGKEKINNFFKKESKPSNSDSYYQPKNKCFLFNMIYAWMESTHLEHFKTSNQINLSSLDPEKM